MALEICRDHGDARARWDLEHAGRSTVDLQLVVSNGVDLKRPAVGMGGVVLVANGDPLIDDSRRAEGGRRVELEEHDHPRHVRTVAPKPTEVALSQSAKVLLQVV